MRALFAAAVMLISVPAQAAGPFGKVVVGNWKGGAYTNDTTGEFSHCAVSASYKSGITMLTSVNRNYGWSLGFAHEDWKIKVGDDIPIVLTFDNRGSISVSGRALSSTFVVIPLPDNSALIRAFRAAQTMRAEAVGQLFQFNLTDTSRMLPALVECVKANSNLVMAPANRPAGVAPAVAPQPSTLPKPAADDGLRLEAVTLATNFLLASQIPNARVLKPGEGSDLGPTGVAWRASDASGQVRIVPPVNGQKGIDVAAGIVAADAKACGGKFASGRTSELVDNDVVFRGFSSCEDSAGPRYAEYYVIPRRKGGFAVFSVATTPGAAASPSNAVEQNRTNFQRAAIKAQD